MKLIWRVAPAPTGRYRSFEKRGWPSAAYNTAHGCFAAWLECEDEYVPHYVRAGRHAEIKVIVLHHNHPEAHGSWKRFALKKRAKTLAEAKLATEQFLKQHPEFWPAGVE